MKGKKRKRSTRQGQERKKKYEAGPGANKRNKNYEAGQRIKNLGEKKGKSGTRQGQKTTMFRKKKVNKKI